MPYDETLVIRLRRVFAGVPDVAEKKMFGGVAFLERGLMVVGVAGAALMARVGPTHYEESLGRAHVREMDFTGRPMRGYVFVDAPGVATDAELRFWVDRCRAFVKTLPAKTR